MAIFVERLDRAPAYNLGAVYTILVSQPSAKGVCVFGGFSLSLCRAMCYEDRALVAQSLLWTHNPHHHTGAATTLFGSDTHLVLREVTYTRSHRAIPGLSLWLIT